MKIELDERLKDSVRSLTKNDKGRILKLISLFGDKGFNLSSNYLKKIDRNLWELRSDRVRLLFGRVNERDLIIFVGVFTKKTQKTPINEIKKAIGRINEYKL
jgi:phage-related protein